MKKLMTIFAILFATITFGQVLGDFPVSPNQGGETESANRQRVIDGSGSYLSNIAPHQLDLLTSYGIVPDNLLIPSGRKASVLYSQYPTDGTGDFTVINAAVKNEINSNGLLEEIAANIAGFNYSFGFPVLEVNEATENLIEDPVSIGSNYWTLSGATIASDPSTKGSDQNVSSTANGDYTTFGGASATGFAATSNGGATHEAGTADEIVVTASNIIRVAFTLTLNSGTAPTVALKDALAGSNIGNSKTQVATAGSNDMYFYGSSATTGVVEFSNTSTATDFVVSVLSVSEVTGFPAPHADSPLDVSAYKLVEDDQTSTHYFTKSAITVTNGVTLTQSIYAKQGERNWLRFEEINSADGYYFDLENGVVGTEIGTTVASSITAASNGYWRISITVTVPSTAAEFRVGLADADNSNSYAGDGSSGLFVAFAQLEELPYASTWTFIAEGGTSSKIADQINSATFSGNSESGVFYVEMAAFTTEVGAVYKSISDGTTDNRVYIRLNNSVSNTIDAVVKAGGVNNSMSYVVSDITEFHKIAVRWRVNDFSLWVDGSEVDTDDTGVSFAAGVLTTIQFDSGAGASDFYGYYKEGGTFSYLSDTQMQQLTTR